MEICGGHVTPWELSHKESWIEKGGMQDTKEHLDEIWKSRRCFQAYIPAKLWVASLLFLSGTTSLASSWTCTGKSVYMIEFCSLWHLPSISTAITIGVQDLSPSTSSPFIAVLPVLLARTPWFIDGMETDCRWTMLKMLQILILGLRTEYIWRTVDCCKLSCRI